MAEKEKYVPTVSTRYTARLHGDDTQGNPGLYVEVRDQSTVAVSSHECPGDEDSDDWVVLPWEVFEKLYKEAKLARERLFPDATKENDGGSTP